jgi:hypothetical protein
MITLQSLTKLENGTYYAKWYDADDQHPDIGHTVAALHHEDGRLDAANLNIRAPRLTAEQMQQAQPDTHRAYALAALGTAKQPSWANRYEKAARLVEAGRVRLTGEDTAVVQGSSDTYEVNGKCTCKWSQFNETPCSHYLAVRMARALAQTILPTTEAEKEAAVEARRQANRDAMQLRVARRGENKFEAARRAQYHTAEGARRYARMAMANGAATIRPDIWQRANGQPAAAGAGGD